MALGKEERALVQKVEQHAYTTIRGVREFQESMKKETSRLKDMATDMDGANIKLKNQSGNPAFAVSHSASDETKPALTRSYRVRPRLKQQPRRTSLS